MKSMKAVRRLAAEWREAPAAIALVRYVTRALGAAVALVLLFTAVAPRVAAQTMDDRIYAFVLVDHLEYAPGAEAKPLEWEAVSWIGGDYERLWLKTEGEYETRKQAGELEAQALYGRVIAPYWDAQVGLRVDAPWGGAAPERRAFLALGLEGLAPYLFEVEPFVFVSREGDVSARLEASYHLLFTQRLIAEPELEVNAAVQEVPEHGIGSGLNDVELGFRVRYEVMREIAPYAGYAWTRRFGATADLVREEGGAPSEGAFVAGLRLWY